MTVLDVPPYVAEVAVNHCPVITVRRPFPNPAPSLTLLFARCVVEDVVGDVVRGVIGGVAGGVVDGIAGGVVNGANGGTIRYIHRRMLAACTLISDHDSIGAGKKHRRGAHALAFLSSSALASAPTPTPAPAPGLAPVLAGSKQDG